MTDIREMSDEQVDQLNTQAGRPKRKRKSGRSTGPAFRLIEDITPEEMAQALSAAQTTSKNELLKAVGLLKVGEGKKIVGGDLKQIKISVGGFGVRTKRKFIVTEVGGEPVVIRKEYDNATDTAE